MSTPIKKPRGAEEVRAALLESAVALYTESGSFSVREIAAKAGVNHGQIHHYFGGKRGLKKAMLEYITSKGDEAVVENSNDDVELMLQRAVQLVIHDPRFVRALARRLLEDPDEPAFQSSFPIVSRLRAAAPNSPPEIDSYIAERLAKVLGWAFFKPWIIQATELEEDAVNALEARLGDLPNGLA